MKNLQIRPQACSALKIMWGKNGDNSNVVQDVHELSIMGHLVLLTDKLTLSLSSCFNYFLKHDFKCLNVNEIRENYGKYAMDI